MGASATEDCVQLVRRWLVRSILLAILAHTNLAHEGQTEGLYSNWCATCSRQLLIWMCYSSLCLALASANVYLDLYVQSTCDWGGGFQDRTVSSHSLYQFWMLMLLDFREAFSCVFVPFVGAPRGSLLNRCIIMMIVTCIKTNYEMIHTNSFRCNQD